LKQLLPRIVYDGAAFISGLS